MVKKLLCLVLVVCLVIAGVPAVYADGGTVQYFCPNCGAIQFQGLLTKHSYCSKCGCLLANWGGGGTHGGGAGRGSITAPKDYYTEPSDPGTPSSGSDPEPVYNAGNTYSYSIINTSNQTLNYTTYNTTTNNYNTWNYNYTSYTYNTNYNYYDVTIDNSQHYYIYDYSTYYIINYPTGETNSDGDAEYDHVQVYYQLPDGRNSYDLEPSDVWGTYFIYDVTSCDKVLEDDGKTLGLWHLDGTLNDASANAGKYRLSFGSTNFVAVDETWGQGVSGVPSAGGLNVSSFDYGSGSYTLEFRVFVTNNNTTDYYNLFHLPLLYKGKAVANMPADFPLGLCLAPNQWNAIAICFDGSVFTFYLNGKKVDYTELYGIYPNYAGAPDWGTLITKLSGYEGNSADRWVLYDDFSGFLLNSGTSASKLTFDEVRLSNQVLYTGDYTVSLQPYDTNTVLVLPEDPEQYQIAIMSNDAVTDYRVGGVRPTYPSKGNVYVYLEEDVVQSVQQYAGDSWQEVEAKIYIDGEWEDLKSKNLSDLKTDEPEDETGGEQPTPSPTPTPDPTEPTPTPDPGDQDQDGDGNIWDDLLGALAGLISGLIEVVGAFLSGILSGVISLLSAAVQSLSSILTLAKDFAGLVSGLYAFLPSEWQLLLTSAFTVLLFLGVIRIFLK